jgi:cation diffusion facilitator family transporter
MAPERRIALVSVGAAVALIAIKLGAGIASGSLGLLSEAAHSGTDLAAALLTFFAVGVAVRPADTGHPYGHGKAQHLAALAEAGVLAAVSLAIGGTAVYRLVTGRAPELDLAWWTFAVIAVVIAIDASRSYVSWRAARRYRNAAFATNALHFAGDLAGSTAVLFGLVLAGEGYPAGDSVAALLVALLVLAAAWRLIARNVDVLMDRAPEDAEAAVRLAIQGVEPPVELRRLRMRHAAGRNFADVVIGVAAGAAVGQGHAAADQVEAAVEDAVPGTDVVVHVEPAADEAALRERAHAAASRVRGVREIHNVAVLDAGGRRAVSLHLKLPGGLPLAEAHEIASAVETAIREELPDVDSVHTHLEPLAADEAGAAVSVEASAAERRRVESIVRDVTGREPRELRLFATPSGLVVFLTLVLGPDQPLADAHASASEIETRIHRELPHVVEAIVHTEPR